MKISNAKSIEDVSAIGYRNAKQIPYPKNPRRSNTKTAKCRGNLVANDRKAETLTPEFL